MLNLIPSLLQWWKGLRIWGENSVQKYLYPKVYLALSLTVDSISVNGR